jgi:alkanesulfonate monooxygenase SsuD/methylene tetrahydromethanopterin reductase-like flavin-dependent oxidoreductase (luciferase family)
VIGVTSAPFIRAGPAVATALARRAELFGYDSFWVAEVTGTEAFGVLGAASAQTASIGLGTGVLPAQVRTPPLLAMAAASLQALNPDREVLLGVGIYRRAGVEVPVIFPLTWGALGPDGLDATLRAAAVLY